LLTRISWPTGKEAVMELLVDSRSDLLTDPLRRAIDRRARAFERRFTSAELLRIRLSGGPRNGAGSTVSARPLPFRVRVEAVAGPLKAATVSTGPELMVCLEEALEKAEAVLSRSIERRQSERRGRTWRTNGRGAAGGKDKAS
jgi:hypothetical protein